MGLADDPVSWGQQVCGSLLTIFGTATFDFYMRTRDDGIILKEASANHTKVQLSCFVIRSLN